MALLHEQPTACRLLFANLPFAAVSLVAVLFVAAHCHGQMITAEDATLLNDLVEQGCVADPSGLEFVAWKTATDTLHVWLVADDHRPADQLRVYWGHDNVPRKLAKSAKIERVDFEAYCRKRFDLSDEPPLRSEEEDVRVPSIQVRNVGRQHAHALMYAAWAHRLGQQSLALELLRFARRSDDDPHEELTEMLSDRAAFGMIIYFRGRTDKLALAYARRLEKIFPKQAEKPKQTSHIIADLERRLAAAPRELARGEHPPVDFSRWNAKRKADFLIDAMEEISEHRTFLGPSDCVDLSVDWRAAAIMRSGETLVPRLIAAAKSDRRLTRLDGGFSQRLNGSFRAITPVNLVALELLRQILRVRGFQPIVDADTAELPKDPAEAHAVRVARLEAYWKEYGRLPIAERLMRVLCNAKATAVARRAAADSLANLDTDPAINFRGRVLNVKRMRAPPDVVVADFHDPTIAQAILRAMDDELESLNEQYADVAHDEKPDPARQASFARAQALLEDAYIFPLIELGDRDIVPELTARIARRPADPTHRRLAYACHWLGDSKPLDALARNIAAGKVAASRRFETPQGLIFEYNPEYADLSDILSYFTRADTPACRAAMDAMTRGEHPLHQAVGRFLIGERQYSVHLRRDWFAPRDLCGKTIWLAMLASQLQDETATGWKYSFSGSWMRDNGRAYKTAWLPSDIVDDPSLRAKVVPERVCDVAANKMAGSVWGIPHYHPLYPDAPARLKRIRDYLSRFQDKLHSASDEQCQALGLPDGAWRHDEWLPMMHPLEHPASEADVKAGRAIFALKNPKRVAEIQLPAVAQLHTESDDDHETALIMQAEVDAAGRTWYGVVRRTGMGKFPQDQVSELKPHIHE